MNAEQIRLQEIVSQKQPWRKWGPYLSERQWGTVREDYGNDGNSWNYFTFEESHYRAYRWGEDGLAGQCDEKQHLCLCLALWNGADPVLKERLFGLTNSQGNHGEDVKEYYYYLDNTPTHSYQKFLYKYPQRRYPYQELLEVSRQRGYHDFEYELLDTGVFQDDRYFDVLVEYAKGGPEDLLMEISVTNRGPSAASLDVLPTLWFRNTWTPKEGASRPLIQTLSSRAMQATYAEGHSMRFEAEVEAQQLFTENETRGSGPFTKGAFHQRLIDGQQEAVNPRNLGTKAAFWSHLEIPAGHTHSLRFRLSREAGKKKLTFKDFQSTLASRKLEADEFYRSRLAPSLSEDQRNVARQALSGMLWSKQYYEYNLHTWLREHRAKYGEKWLLQGVRNRGWRHMVNRDIISMPDKWEYPWYAAWDLAFHTVSLAVVDLDFAKRQLHFMMREVYLHPNGQLPAYEWNFSDVNPPVHAWATLYVYFYEKNLTGKGDLDFLKAAFHKLLLNFTWWVNRKDRNGQNVFEGGFLGLDNIGVFDRSSPLPTGGFLEQADGTAWMCLFCQNMLEMSLELANLDENYIEMSTKFLEHFTWIAAAMDKMGDREDEMWDEQDGFFYDLLRLPNGESSRLRVRSMVGLLPFCAASTVDHSLVTRFSGERSRVAQRLDENPEMVANMHDPRTVGPHGRHLLSILDEKKLRRILVPLLDPDEFLSDFGIRSLSRYHQNHPFVMNVNGQEFRVDYAPAESTSGMFGGNSNWRGPIWFPVNILIVRALLSYHGYYGEEFKVECPTGSGNLMNLYEVAREISGRLSSIFLRNSRGQRPVFGGSRKFQDDPHWRDHMLFYEYFHGDNGAGLGASHQTGWTGLVAPLMNLFAHTSSQDFLERGRAAAAYRESEGRAKQ
ncbi:glucosidase [bacterium]|nr:glucosidase [bacterium]